MYKGFYYSRPDKLDKCFCRNCSGLNKLINLLIKEKPDLILLTFPTPVMSVLTEQFNINIPVATVMTTIAYIKTGLRRIQQDIMATKKTEQNFMT